MLNTVVVALDERIIANLLMGDTGSITLTLHSVGWSLDSVTLQLERRAIMELSMLLDLAQEAAHRGAVLTGQMEYKLETEDAVIKARQSQNKLPF